MIYNIKYSSDFISLLRISVGIDEPVLDKELTDSEWNQLYVFAKLHSMIGILSAGAFRLPEAQKPHNPLKLKLALTAEKIQEKNALLLESTKKLVSQLDEIGLRSCVLKGQGIARLYFDPTLRQSGDIDVWVEGDMKNILAAIRKSWKIGDVFYHHTDIHPFKDKINVEVHFRPTWMNNPFANRKLQRYFKECSSEQFDNYIPELGFCSSTMSLNCVLGALHVYRHVLFEGIGLRQVTDYYYILKHSTALQKAHAYDVMKNVGMTKFIAALMYVEEQLFSLDEKYLICSPDRNRGEFLLGEILSSGNFGNANTKNKVNDSTPFVKRIIIRIRHLWHCRLLGLSEVFWGPYFKAKQLVWRKINGY